MILPSWNLVYQVSLVLFTGLTVLHALLNKRDPRAALGWIVLCVLVPIWGAVLYWLLGVNRVRTLARTLQLRGHWRHSSATGEHRTSHLLPARHGARRALETLIPMSERITRRPLMVGNRVEMLENGEEAYPRMLEDVRNARRFVYLTTYILDDDATGREFIDALGAAKGRGVEVRVLLDAQGLFYSRGCVLRALRRAGVRTARFLPLSLTPSSLHLNLRNHRKILVVDGRTGFTGGMNIGDRHRVTRGGIRQKVKDLHFRFEGPLVGEMLEVFIEDWYFTTKESLPWTPYPERRLPGRAVCRGISDGPNEDFEKLHWLLLGVLSWARKSVKIMTPYFVPSREIVAALNTAALRGVKVEILLPGMNNHPLVDWASRAYLWEMLLKGVRFYEQPPPLVHSKVLVADGMYALVGSGNMDNRSLRLNFEFDVEVYEPAFVRKLEAHFDAARGQSRVLTLAEMDGKPLWVKVRDRSAKLLSSYL